MVPQSEYLEENLVILSLRNFMGNLGLAAMDLGLSRGELVAYIARHPDVAEARQQVREAVKDVAEDILFEKMKTDNQLLVFFLRTQAKDRGYSTTVNSTINNRVEVNVDARSLIAAMRNGANLIDVQDEDEADESEDGELFTFPNLLDHGDGSGRTGEVLP
jgi:hypothetical protein